MHLIYLRALDMSPRYAKRFILHGRVQGVGCRMQILDLVENVGDLSGFVRNRANGTVEVCVKGAEWRIDEVERQLRNSLRSPVTLERVDVENLLESDLSQGFQILR